MSFISERIDKRRLAMHIKGATAADVRAFAAELDRLEVANDATLEVDADDLGVVLSLEIWQ